MGEKERKSRKKLYFIFIFVFIILAIVSFGYILSSYNPEPPEPERIMVVSYRQLDSFTVDNYFTNFEETPFVRFYIEVENQNCGKQEISRDNFKVEKLGEEYYDAHWAIFEDHGDWEHYNINNGETVTGILVFEFEEPVTEYSVMYETWSTYSG